MKTKIENDNENSVVRSPSIKRRKIMEHTNYTVLKNKSFLVNDKFIIRLNRTHSPTLFHNTKANCKVLEFSSIFDITTIETQIKSLNISEYPQLFIFVFTFDKVACGDIEKLKTILLEFNKVRPIILQVSSEREKVTKIFYKKNDCNEFYEINQNNNINGVENFTTFLWSFLTDKTDNISNYLSQETFKIDDSPTIVKFLNCFKKIDKGEIIKSCAKYGSELHLLEAFEISKENIGTFSKLANCNAYENLQGHSVLSMAIEGKNTSIFNYLINDCKYWMKELSYDRQVHASNTAYYTYEPFLCDLLQKIDFPFPKENKIYENAGENLKKIIEDRQKLEAAIKNFDENLINFNEISEFKKNAANKNVSVAYNVKNESAIYQAHQLKKPKLIKYLVSQGYKLENNEKVKEKIGKNEIFEITWMNIECSRSESEKSIKLVALKSSIYNETNQQQEEEQRKKIIQYYRKINKSEFGSKMLDIAAQCESLKIVFDFEHHMIKNVDVRKGFEFAEGITFRPYRFIIIGAKSSNEREEDNVRGTVAHELCHYVLDMVYDNDCEPYYKNDAEAEKEFKGITADIKQLVFKEDKRLDDQCNGIISGVFVYYKNSEHSSEMAVRASEILACYVNDDNKQNELQVEYKKLFDFCRDFVLFEMKKFNYKIQTINKTTQLLDKYKCKKHLSTCSNGIDSLMTSKLLIWTTNSSSLLVNNIDKYFRRKEEYKDVRNIYLNSTELTNPGISEMLKGALLECSNANIVIVCKNTIADFSNSIIDSRQNNVILIVSNENDRKALEIFIKAKYPQEQIQYKGINYKWADMSNESKNDLLKTKINFQNQILRLCDIQKQMCSDDFVRIMDYGLLTLLLNNQPISINSELEEQSSKNYISSLFRLRNLVMKSLKSNLSDNNDTEENENNEENMDIDKEEAINIKKYKNIKTSFNDTTISKKKKKNCGYGQDELRMEVTNEHFVLISDVAGSGKSWLMKNLTEYLRTRLGQWTTYVDLKNHFQKFKQHDGNVDFVEFMVENILKLETELEKELFKILFNNGKVITLFDGFDEIAPDCTDIVIKLINSFHHNGGNQMWIATREQHEKDLQKELHLKSVIQFEKLEEKEGANIITYIWIYDDMIKCKTKPENINENEIEHHKNYNDYRSKAEKIVKEIAESANIHAYGFPLFYFVIAIIFKIKKICDETKINKIFIRYVDNLCEEWSTNKGDQRKAQSIQSHKYTLGYWGIHHFFAMDSLFPDIRKLCNLQHHEDEWPELEILGCGIIIKCGKSFQFPHKMFTEFFASDYVAKYMKDNIKIMPEQFCEFVVKLLTISEHSIVRMFLNDALVERNILAKYENDFLNKFGEKIVSDMKPYRVFEENLENFSNIYLKLFELKKYDKIIKTIYIAQWSRIGKNICCSHKPLCIGEDLKIRNQAYPNVHHSYEHLLLISFKLKKNEIRCLWRKPKQPFFYSIEINGEEANEVAAICHEFLKEIMENEDSYRGERSYKSKKDIRIHDIVDRKQNNILMIAVEKNQPSRVKILLDYDFDVDYSNNYDFSAIDIAWNNFVKQENLKEKDESNQIILYLLKASSRFPNDFDYEKASEEVKEFVNNCESLHKYVDEDNFDSLKLKLKFEPHLVYFYNRNNESLLFHSIKNTKVEIIHFLLTMDISIGYHENPDDIYKNMIKKDRNLHKQKKINELPERHILILESKSRITSSGGLLHEQRKFIDEAFKTINRNESCSKILKVAAECKKLSISFDFKHDSTYYTDPVRSTNSKLFIHEGGSIYIGAKYLNDDVKKFEVFGVLIHEMYHVAISMTFMNQNCDPFPVGESANKTRFIDQVMVQCKKQKNREVLVANVINLYNENCHISKIIAIVPQIEIHYGQNAKKFQKKFKELFNYSREVVEPELEKALPVLKILNDEEMEINYTYLTKPMQVYILHSKINFQGAETTLNELVSDNYNILELLTSENIRGILMRDKNLEIGSVCKLYQNCEMLQRSLTESKICVDGKIVPRSDALDRIQDNKDYELLRKNVDQIRIEMKDSKFLLLSDYAGTGKTTFFKSWAIKLKENYKNMWISCINLRKYRNVFKKFTLTIDKLSGTEIHQILKEIVDCKSKFEEALFSKLFSEGKAILMLDGFDEICPQYSDLFMKIFSLIIKNSSNNEFWISTRPHHADKLQQLFKTPIYMFLPCKEDEILQFIEEYLKVNKFSDEKSLKNNSRSIYNTVKEISSKQLQDFNQQPNILIIVLITKLYIQNRIKIGSENLYSIFEALVEEQQNKPGETILIAYNEFLFELSIWDIHRVLALILIFEKDYENELEFKLEELALMKRWKKAKGYWTSDAIQRYGFIIVDLNEDLRNSIYFVHNIFAEFFVASFLINSIFAFNSITDANDIEKIFKIVDTIVLREKAGLENLCEIFFSYIKSETITENFSFEEEIEAAINEKIQAIHNIAENEFPLKYFYNLSKLVSVDKKLLNKLWKLDQDQTIVEKILRNENSVNFEYFCSTVEWCFGKSWHKIFNISKKELITDEELENLSLKDDEKEKGKHYKNLIKLLDLIKIIFDQETCKELYDKVNLNMISINEIRNIVISKIN